MAGFPLRQISDAIVSCNEEFEKNLHLPVGGYSLQGQRQYLPTAFNFKFPRSNYWKPLSRLYRGGDSGVYLNAGSNRPGHEDKQVMCIKAAISYNKFFLTIRQKREFFTL